MLRFPCLALSLLTASAAAADISVHGSLQKWHPLIVDNATATEFSELQETSNPFLDYRYNVIFTSPDGNEYVVPGYFAGNGQGQGSGSTWRAKFAADETGVWQYRVSFRSGNNIAVSLEDDEGTPLPSDGETGTFTIASQQPDDPGFLPYGRLQYNGGHYLKFADGPYWIKGGIDSPENFFGYAGFDNTIDQAAGAKTITLADGVHRYPSHIADWQDGDPLFTNAASPESAKAIIGAVNYLSTEGVNSIYFLPMNLGGDGRETYPFVSPEGGEANNTRYDISKLFQWSIVLDHMQNKGIAAHIVLGETENRNTLWLDDATLGVQRKLYYREMIARFSHLLALKWNLSEESRYTDDNHREFAEYIRALDWAEHPIGVHTLLNSPEETYDSLLGNPAFDITSIQFSVRHAGRFVEEWRQKTSDAGWPWVIDMDEVDPAPVGLNGSNSDELRKAVLYPVYFSGGNIEWYFGYHELPLGGDMRTEDFRTRESMYRYMRYARELMQNELPFWEMQPADDLYESADSGGVEVFAKTGESYAVYLPVAVDTGALQVAAGEYELRWFNPRTGTFSGRSTTFSAGLVELGTAPSEPAEDWVVLLQRLDKVDTTDPDATDPTNGGEIIDGEDTVGQTTDGEGEGEGEGEGDIDTGDSTDSGQGNGATIDKGTDDSGTTDDTEGKNGAETAVVDENSEGKDTDTDTDAEAEMTENSIGPDNTSPPSATTDGEGSAEAEITEPPYQLSVGSFNPALLLLLTLLWLTVKRNRLGS